MGTDMPYNPDDPEILLPPYYRSSPHNGFRWRLAIVGAALFVLFLLVHNGVPLYTDWLWFGEVGRRDVFGTTILAKTELFFTFGLLFFAIFYGNLRLAQRLAPSTADAFLVERLGRDWARALQRWIGWILFGVALFCSLWAGRIASDYWANFLEFRHGVPFGVHDPVFGLDAGFYVFRLPFLRFVWTFLLVTILLAAAATIAFHVADRAIDSLSSLPNVSRGVRMQILLLAAGLVLVVAFGTRLSAYDLLTTDNGVFSGPGYTDLHYRLLALNVEIVVLLATAAACLGTAWRGKGFQWPALGIAMWLLAIFVVGGVVPGLVEKFEVEPNQFALEGSYIARNIRFTRLGFGLQNVQQSDTFPADDSLDAAGLTANQGTLDNVRLWDYNFIGKVYSQLQTIKTYYKFEKDALYGGTVYNIDIDRYRVGGRLRQVMLGAREMDPSGLPASAQTWQNQRLAYTHGYGVAMSPVNRTVQGAPDYFIKDIPVTVSRQAPELRVTQPDIYFGQLSSDYVFVDTTQQEFDYPSAANDGAGSQDHYTTYHGTGGIRIGDSELAKLAFSLRFGDPNILLASGFRSNTRVLFHRDIRERLQLVAPFVTQDGDPYMVVDPDTGRLVWIVDCYTMSDRFPYSRPETIGVDATADITPNYVRNSVKAVVDAYNGTITLFMADPQDPIARTYSDIFPGLLKPLTDMPAGLRAHLRYPEDLFRLQRSVYATYHVEDPRVFYQKEDTWSIPTDPNADATSMDTPTGARPPMEPYYVVMRLRQGATAPADAGSEEFLLMSPLAPVNGEDKNILGWMCARCDGPHYGELVLYRFRQSTAINGPTQIMSLINDQPAISQRLSLWRSSGGGSNAIFGNLLVIPVDKSLLYIAPLYIEATASNKLPQLQKVVVAFGNREARVAMGDTLEEALAELFPGYGGSAPAPGQPSAPAGAPGAAGGSPLGPLANPTLRSLVTQAAQQYDNAQARLRAGDFAGYGTAEADLKRTIDRLRSLAK